MLGQPSHIAKVHILGGGVAGLAAAYYIKQKSPQTKTVIYEAAPHIGGRAFSYEDKSWQLFLDNATHGILGANKEVLKFWSGQENASHIPFCSLPEKKLSYNPLRFIPEILLSIFNTPAAHINKKSFAAVLLGLFPFLPRQTRLFYSAQNLTPALLENFLSSVDELKMSWRLKAVEGEKNIERLVFSSQLVEVGEDERVISALDDRAYHNLFGSEIFAHNRIVNIFFHTSVKLWLPGEKNVLGIAGGVADWYFVHDKILAATISNFQDNLDDKEAFARKIWSEFSSLRNQKPAFLPAYKILDYKYATIRQDKDNNAKRPQNCRTKYDNLFLAGDWTMRNYPCCLNGAVLSAKRAVKAIF